MLTSAQYLLIMELRFDVILHSKLGSENPDAGHIKCPRGPQIPQPCCTGSGFWSSIRPDIRIFFELDWISFPFQPEQDPDYPIKKTVAMQNT